MSLKIQTYNAKLFRMNKILIFLMFLFILAFYIFANFLIYRVIVSVFSVESVRLKIFVGSFIFLSAISFFVYEFTVGFFKIEFLHYYSYLWMGFITLSFLFFLMIHVLDLINIPYLKTVSIVLLAFIFILSIVSVINGLKFPEVKKIVLEYKDLPENLNGYKIVHLSDLHLGSIKRKNWTKHLVSIVNKLNPDLILMTGDLIDRGVQHMKEDFYTLKKLKTKDGVFTVTGNHEFYSKYKLFVELTDKTGIKRVKNECVKIAPNLEIVGMDDPEVRQFFNEKITLEEIINNCSKDSFKIFLYHRPEYFDKTVKYGIRLQLSGHTHNGQIFPVNIIVSLVYKYPYGLYKKGDSYIYTTSGASTWGPPMRLFSKNEVVLITLKRKK